MGGKKKERGKKKKNYKRAENGRVRMHGTPLNSSARKKTPIKMASQQNWLGKEIKKQRNKKKTKGKKGRHIRGGTYFTRKTKNEEEGVHAGRTGNTILCTDGTKIESHTGVRKKKYQTKKKREGKKSHGEEE